jgi:hypothetical protein
VSETHEARLWLKQTGLGIYVEVLVPHCKLAGYVVTSAHACGGNERGDDEGIKQL